MLGKTFFNKFKQNKRNLEKRFREVMAPERIDLLMYFLLVSISLKIKTGPNEIPTKCELLIFKDWRTLIISSQTFESLNS